MTVIDPRSYGWIKISKADGIATLTLSNPQKRNAVSSGMHHELERVWADVDADDEIRVVVLTGEGNAFCAGADFSPPTDETAKTPRRPETRQARRLFWNMLEVEKPVIAKVRGPAYGLGASIALAADVVVAADGARFCDSHVKMGIAPGDGGAVLWPLLIGFHRAKELLMTGEPIDAQRASEIGLINHCIREKELDAFVEQLARRLASGAPLAISYAKISVNLLLKQLAAGAFEASLAYDLLTLSTEDHAEGTRAFREKRNPKFKGV
jgi:enoyl-CoA hydratase